ncbi:hypothetical protein BY996DRAFT_6413118 [Phakopsora pachyrhizi]|nr:hypothetical protein BY996DRAFT_6413118 [Phakopsora pachyrhizi]
MTESLQNSKSYSRAYWITSGSCFTCSEGVNRACVELLFVRLRVPKLQPPPRELAPEVSGVFSVDAKGFNLGGIHFSRQHPHIEHFLYSDFCPCQIGSMTRCPSRIAAAIARREMKFKAGARSKHSVGSESSSMQRFRKGWDKWWDNGRDETKKTVQVKDKKGYRVNK